MLRQYRMRTTRNFFPRWAAIAGLLFIIAMSAALIVTTASVVQ